MSEVKTKSNERSSSSSKQKRYQEAIDQFDSYEAKRNIRDRLNRISSTPVLSGLPNMNDSSFAKIPKPKILTLEQFKQKVTLGKLNSSFSISQMPGNYDSHKLDMSLTNSNDTSVLSLVKPKANIKKRRLPGIIDNKIDKLELEKKSGTITQIPQQIINNPVITDPAARKLKQADSNLIIKRKPAMKHKRTSTPTNKDLNLSLNSSLNRTMSPKKRKPDDGTSGYSITVPLPQFLEENQKEVSIYEMTKFLPLELYDPILDPETPRKLLEQLKIESKDGLVHAHSKWFFADGTYEWRDCIAQEYDVENDRFIIIWPSGKIKRVSRINLRFPYDNEEDYEKRIDEAWRHRENAEKVLRFNYMVQITKKDSPDMPLRMLKKIIQFLQGFSKKNKFQLRNPLFYALIDLEVRHQPRRYLWKKERTHLIDESAEFKKKGFASCSEYKEDYLKKLPEIVIYFYSKRRQIPKDQIFSLVREIEETWTFASKQMDFEADLPFNTQKQELLSGILPPSKLVPPSKLPYISPSASQPLPKPKNFLKLLGSMNGLLHQSFPDHITILNKINTQLLELGPLLLFPKIQTKPLKLEKFVRAHKLESIKFLKEARNVMFDAQYDVQDIINQANLQRMKRNEDKIQARAYEQQHLDLEECLPTEFIQLMQRLLSVLNTQIENKLRDVMLNSFNLFLKRLSESLDLLPDSFEDLNGEEFRIFRKIKGKSQGCIKCELIIIDRKFSIEPNGTDLQENIMDVLNTVIQDLSLLPTLETTLTGPVRSHNSLHIFEINQKKHHKMMENISNALKKQLYILHCFEVILEPYSYCISLDPHKVRKRFSKDLNVDAIEDEIFKMKRTEIEIGEFLDSGILKLGVWSIKVANAKEEILEKIRRCVDVLLSLIEEDVQKRMNGLQELHEESIQVIGHEPRNLEELDGMRTFLNVQLPARLDFIKQEFETLFTDIEVLEGYLRQIPWEMFKQMWNCYGYRNQLETIKDSCMKSIAKNQGVFAQQLIKDQTSMLEKIDQIEEELKELKKADDIMKFEDYSYLFGILKNRIQNANEKTKVINFREGLVGAKPTDFKQLEQVKKEFNPYCKLWFHIRDFFYHSPKWYKGHMNELDREAISTELSTILKEVLQMERTVFKEHPQALKLTQELLKNVNEFKPYLPIIRHLSNPGLRDRHWADLEKRAGLQLSRQLNFSLEWAIENGIMKHQELIEEISEQATREQSLENAKAKMESDWDNVNLQIIPFKGSYILVNNEGIWEMLDEQIMKTISMCSSPYIAFMEKEILVWKNNLLRIQDVLDEWEKLQKNWQYLQPIFLSKDISKQLPNAALRFKSINSQWENLMISVHSNPHVLETCLSHLKLLEQLKYANDSLDAILKSLKDYLNSKRKTFPRFYFLSNDELLVILSNSRDIPSVQKYIVKCFEGIRSLIINENFIIGMDSPEDEIVNFCNPIALYEGEELKNIECWLLEVEQEMRKSLKMILVDSVQDYSQENLKGWTEKWPSQVIYACSMMLWTSDVENAIITRKLALALREKEQRLDILVELVRSDLPAQARMTLGTLVVLDVHCKDIIQNLIENKVVSIEEFQWNCHLRYYLNNNSIEVKMLDTQRDYGYEYLGIQSRLVITPLTDRCYRTLMCALHMSLGGAPEGPAGTGKTETTKDLAKSMAKKCVVFNCSDRLDHVYMAKFFTGLCYCGAWACFDEFNRIELEVLSVIAEQILSIQMAVQRKSQVFVLDEELISLDHSCAVFITMNPDYAGRSQLPDNLKALFRPVAMMIPDYAMIAEIYLYSYGFRAARPLAIKLVNSLKLSSEQLSTQHHYDYGMRAVTTVIRAAGYHKQISPDEYEEKLIMKAISESNYPKFTAQDRPLFQGILHDLFPNFEDKIVENANIGDRINIAIMELGFINKPEFSEKVVQLYNALQIRHGVMIVGSTMAGKSSVIKVLTKSVKLKESITIGYINPKGLTLEQLYGSPDPVTHDWNDGILARYIRNYSENTTDAHQWIVLDGPVDVIWIENMNTVLDDNKKLCLSSGEIIKLTPTMRLLFEVDDLSQASPATVSRCGMVYMDPNETLGPHSLLKRWLNSLPLGYDTNSYADFFELAFEKILLPCLEFWKTELKSRQSIQSTSSSVVSSFLKIFESLLIRGGKSRLQHDQEIQEERRKEQEKLDQKKNEEIEGNLINLSSKRKTIRSVSIKQEVTASIASREKQQKDEEHLANLATLAVVWSLGGTCDEDGKKMLSEKLRAEMVNWGYVGLPSNLCESYYNKNEKRWIPWKNLLSTLMLKEEKNILVPTVLTLSYDYLLNELIPRKIHILITGETGTGKSVIIKAYTEKLNEKAYMIGTTIFSARSSSDQSQEFIESKLVKRKKGHFGPEVGKNGLLIIDDLNMPSKDSYGAQPAIEVLRQAIDRNELYDRKTLELKILEDLTYIGIMGHPGGGRNHISSRFSSHFVLMNFSNYDTNSLFTIISTALSSSLNEYARVIADSIPQIANASIKVYLETLQTLPPTPMKSHYTFNIRDLMNVVKGITAAPPQKLYKVETLYKIWVHECLRAFSDRLICDDDRRKFMSLVKRNLNLGFKVYYDNAIEAEPIFCSFLDDKIYQEVSNIKRLKDSLENSLEDYNSATTAKMNLVLFDFAVRHITRISRVLTWNCGNLLLIGVGGSGRQSLTKLCSFVLEYKVFQIKLTKSYGFSDWSADLKQLINISGVECKHVVFILRDNEIIQESFLESINNLLNSGQVPNLFTNDEMQGLTDKMRQNRAFSLKNEQQKWEAFLELVKKNLHIVLCMSPIGDTLKSRLRQFPSLVNCCTIDWFSEWPSEALSDVAAHFMEEEGFSGYTQGLKNASKVCVYFHQSVRELSQEYLQEYRRYNYVTPTHYLQLLNNLKNLFRIKEETTIKLKNKYSQGIYQLNQAQQHVEKLREDLIALKPILEQKTVAAEQIVQQIQKENEDADQTRIIVESEQQASQEQAAKAERIKKECEEALAIALPELESAIKALDTLKREDLNLVKTMQHPPDPIRLTLEALAIMCGESPTRVKDTSDKNNYILDYFETGKRMLNNPKFIKKLKKFNRDALTDTAINPLTEYMDNPKFQPSMVKNASSAAEGLCKWIRAMYNFYHVNNEVKPKQEALKTAKEIMKEKLLLLKEKQEKLDRVEMYIKELKEKLMIQNQEKEALQNEIQLCEIKKERAVKLIEKLGGERERWGQKVDALSNDMKNLLGDILLSAGVVSYMGPFMWNYRDQLIISKWIPYVQSSAFIDCSKNFSLIETVGDPIKIQNWTIHGLPSDKVSIENAIILNHSTNWPLIIDPQGQAAKWLRKMVYQGDKKLLRVKVGSEDFLSVLENALFLGASLIIEDTGETLDPILESVLQKQVFMEDGMKSIKIGEVTKQYDDDFALYMLTNLPNPHYTPETSTKVTILNFTITEEGLSEQLLAFVCRKEIPRDTEERNRLIIQSAEYMKNMQAFEDKILEMLQSGGDTILDNEELINSLTESKKMSEEVERKLTTAKQSEHKIQQFQANYEPAAALSSVLYFCVADLANLDPMYQFSMDWFLALFKKALSEAEKAKEIHDRVKHIVLKFREKLFQTICSSLCEEDKFLFVFLMAIRIMKHNGEINPWEWRFFLTGMWKIAEARESPLEFISDKQWREVCQLSEKVEGFEEHLLKHSNAWRNFVNSDNNWTFIPSFEEFSKQIPHPYQEQPDFMKLLILRAVKPESLGVAIKAFIKTVLGESYLHPPLFSFQNAYNETSPLKPLIFILSSGNDPQALIKRYTTEHAIYLTTLSLGKGQGERAQKAIKESTQTGNWVLLQNCHLAISWLPTLDSLIDKLQVENERSTVPINPSFRLILTSSPTSDFPSNLLHRCIKARSQSPNGLLDSMVNTYQGISASKEESQFYFSSAKPNIWGKLFFGLCFFHCVIKERTKYGAIGFNIPYEFNESDLRISSRQLMLMINNSDNIPYEALIHLTAECNYGGRVTDDWDRRLLKEILTSFYKPGILGDQNFSLTDLVDGYHLPSELSSLEFILDHIRTFPEMESPEVFGLHPNAEISRSRNEAYDLCNRLLSLKPRAVESTFEAKKEQLLSLSEKIINKLNKKFDIEEIEKKYPLSYNDTLNTVLLQEVARYNNLLECIMKSLEELKKAHDGTILITVEQESLGESMLKNQIPKKWKQISYPTNKNLVSWVEDLNKRIQFFNTWISEGRPAVFWISGFFFTQSFLTSILQEFARLSKNSIDSLTFSFDIIKNTAPEPPQVGAYVDGLYLEAAMWDGNGLVECLPRMLYSELPILWLKPEVKSERKTKNDFIYECPMYRTLTRAGTLSTTGHSTNFIMPVLLPSLYKNTHWVKRGTALFTQLDD
ncbi:unnamed protein product [Blepharisma stoltei]|uniref:AAA+ ATPase domain-containing protein n=1 Tax=Blepharisma stoltei TaxID=1481888 RepID=A0AAU9J892_9CILI|nr:unnamed protein product [Blepharisma stoltei]